MEILFDENISVNLKDISEYEIDVEMEEKFKEVLNETEKWLDIEIGSCNKEMYISNTKIAQLEKHSITSFIKKFKRKQWKRIFLLVVFLKLCPVLEKN